jgi:hypothetical protein
MMSADQKIQVGIWLEGSLDVAGLSYVDCIYVHRQNQRNFSKSEDGLYLRNT